MRRMNYPRFDKPTYTGTFDSEQNSFVLDEAKGFFPDHEPEPGIYFVIIKDKEENQEFPVMFVVSMDMTTNGCWYSPTFDDFGKIWYVPGDGPIIAASPNAIVHAGSTIELYKLN